MGDGHDVRNERRKAELAELAEYGLGLERFHVLERQPRPSELRT